MSPLVSTVNSAFALLTVLMHLALAVLLITWFFPTGRAWLHHSKLSFEAKLRTTEWAMRLAFLVALATSLGSLFYSDVAGFAPCNLCWYQRIALYPQVILLGLALWKRDNGVWRYSLALSVIGAVIAGYQSLLQFGIVPAALCLAVGSTSCAQRFVLAFGYVTIPMMSFTTFALLGLLSLATRGRTPKFPQPT